VAGQEVKIRFSCDNCGKAFAAKESLAGRRVACSGCGSAMVVPPAPAKPAARPVAKPLPISEDEEPETLDLSVKRTEDEGLDMTPMVDVTFLLLIFFMVTAAFSLQMSLEVPPPDSDEAAETQRPDPPDKSDSVIIQIAKDNTVWVNDREAPSEQDLLIKLREALDGDSGGAGPSSLWVMANRDCRHDVVVQALDAGNAVGLQDIRLSYVDDDEF
jgi:biopolymer transport protein ExbD